MSRESESEFVQHIPCEACGSSDANSLFSDGHAFCFSCNHFSASAEAPSRKAYRHMDVGFLTGDVVDIPKRGLTATTCQKFGYKIGLDKAGRTVQIADYRDAEGSLVAQKLRDASKNFVMLGEGKRAPLFGMNLWKEGGKRLVVTEGEIDAMSIAQVFNLSWPVVSLPNGAQAARRSLANHIEWLETFEEVVLAFDMDEVGRAAVADCVSLFSPGKCLIAEFPLKDANAMLVAGRGKEVSSSIWQARVYRPDGIVTLEDIRERAMTPLEMGLPWCFSGITEATHGRHKGDVIGFGAATGAGKTDFITQQIEYDLNALGLTVGVLMLEQDVADTARRVAGKMAGKRFHVMNAGWQPEEFVAAFDALSGTGRLHLYDNYGVIDWATIKGKIRYMVEALGCQVIYLDNLTALLANEADERRALDMIMADMAMMAKGKFILTFVSHLTTPDGKSHEEGGRVMAKHFTGSRAIMRWSHLLIGLERNQQAEDTEERSRSTLRMLKERLSGDSAGRTWTLTYDRETGRLREEALPTDF